MREERLDRLGEASGTGPRGGVGRAWAICAFALAVLLGGALRLAELGEPHFVGDELDHYYAATALARGEGPTLPSGIEYGRGIELTRMVRVTTSLIDDPELAARLPSAAFGTLAVVLIGLIGWRLGGPWTGVWAALLLAIYPEAVVQSRQTRFYTLQLCLGLVALYAGFRATDPAAPREGARKAIWAGVAVLAFLAALRVQLTTFSVIAAWGLWVLVCAAVELGRSGWRAAPRSVPVVLAALGGAAAFGVLLFAGGWVGSLTRVAGHVPAWAGDGGDVRVYYWALSTSFPILLGLAPVSYVAVAVRARWLALYLFLWFAVPVAIHSLLLPWKAERYVLLAIPALLLASAIAAGTGASALRRRLAAALERPEAPDRAGGRARAASAALVTLIALFAIATSRAFNESRRLPGPHEPKDWTRAFELVRAHGAGMAPIGASQPLTALFYGGRVDFVVGVDFLELPGTDSLREEGAPDWYAGLPVLTRPGSIRARFSEADTVALVIERSRWEHGNIAPELRAVLPEEATEVCRDRCGALYLFLWSPSTASPEGTTSTNVETAGPST